MKYELVPVVRARDLEVLLSEKANIDVCEIRSLLFYDDYVNDSYKKLYFADDESADGWEPTPTQIEEMKARNALFALLREEFPDREDILVDVSW
jgi:hypothetical protein